MKRTSLAVVALALAAGIVLAAAADAPKPDKDGWYQLFNGKNLDGWKASENKDCFKVEDGCIVANGKRSHLFYDGPVADHDFRNFELLAEVQTFPQSNSGIFFHTEYRETGWPAKGYECQINATHSDPKKTGGLYAVRDVMDTAPPKDGEWFTYSIKVEGKHVVIKINDKVTCDFTEPDDGKGAPRFPGRKVSHGTIALQGHDPGSKVLYRSVKIRPLPN